MSVRDRTKGLFRVVLPLIAPILDESVQRFSVPLIALALMECATTQAATVCASTAIQPTRLKLCWTSVV